MDFSHKIDTEELREVFQSPFGSETWKTLLIQVFGANKLFVEPMELDNVVGDKVHGYKLGEIITPDKYTIGLFQFEIKAGHKIPMNRVGLRGLVEKEIKYFYDAALVVYYNDTQWRLSFICDLRDEKTAPKRFTYVFGDKDRSYRTPISRFEYIKSKGASKDVIHEAFSVEALNKEFYGFIAKRFYQLVGATTGTGKNKTEHKRVMRLPCDQDSLVYQEFAVRLIGRTVFCWFLKEKKSGNGEPLLPVELLSSKSLKTYNDYYHTVLERIFFQTLNTPIKERVKNLPKGCELIPFLNGGLFDYRPHDFYAPEEDGLSKYRSELQIPDEWFAALFAELEQYNFTIDENSPDDIEVSVDPEMLGRIFENLLAEIDPDSGETARKATGSFYTPREIVDYMAVESLVYYLNRKTGLENEKLHTLFNSTEAVEFSEPEREKLLVALDELKILDPACGSGAFPMGVLAKITGALHILDKDGAWWKERQLRRIDNAKVRQDMQHKLDTATVEYARKIGIIQNTLYGVDIQPIAAEISKLRCFLTLIVDENVDDSKSNRGVDPLPNLEFKFITADSLMKLPPANIFGSGATDDIERLRQLRINYLQSYGATKSRIKDEFRKVQHKIYNDQAGNSTLDSNSREYKISHWDPFGNEKSDWFDPEWMFGVTSGFDIVIGNPPYVQISKGRYSATDFPYAEGKDKGKQNLYKLFVELSYNMITDNRFSCLIVQSSLLCDFSSKHTRELLLDNTTIEKVVEFPKVATDQSGQVFESVLQGTCIAIFRKTKPCKNHTFAISIDNNARTIGELSFEHVEQERIKGLYPEDYSIPLLKAGYSTIVQKVNGRSIKVATIIDSLSQGDINLTGAKSKITRERTGTKLLRGRNISRYHIDYHTDEYIVDDFGQDAVSINRSHLFLVCQEVTGTVDKRRLHFAPTIQDERFLFGHTANKLCIKPSHHPHFVLAMLNSTLLDRIFRITSTNNHVGGYEIKQLPILDVDRVDQQPFVDLVDQILAAKAANPAADTSALESEIDRMVYDLYGLSDDEIQIIEKQD